MYRIRKCIQIIQVKDLGKLVQFPEVLLCHLIRIHKYFAYGILTDHVGNGTKFRFRLLPVGAENYGFITSCLNK